MVWGFLLDSSLILKLTLRKYQRQFLEDPLLKLGSITLTEGKVIVAFEMRQATAPDHASLMGYDTNELSLDGALSNRSEIKLIHVDLRSFVIAILKSDYENCDLIQNNIGTSNSFPQSSLSLSDPVAKSDIRIPSDFNQ